jgi:hypothetical protein
MYYDAVIVGAGNPTPNKYYYLKVLPDVESPQQ